MRFCCFLLCFFTCFLLLPPLHIFVATAPAPFFATVLLCCSYDKSTDKTTTAGCFATLLLCYFEAAFLASVSHNFERQLKEHKPLVEVECVTCSQPEVSTTTKHCPLVSESDVSTTPPPTNVSVTCPLLIQTAALVRGRVSTTTEHYPCVECDLSTTTDGCPCVLACVHYCPCV